MTFLLSCIPQEIIDGLIIGVGAGVTTSAILGTWRWIVRWSDRREQIRYFRDLITASKEPILSTKDFQPSAQNQKSTTVDHARLALYNALNDDIQTAIKYRASSLTYKEVSSLQRIFTEVNRLKAFFGNFEILPLLIAKENLYDKLEELDWLRLGDERCKWLSFIGRRFRIFKWRR